MGLKDEFNQLAKDMIYETFADIAQTITVKSDASVYNEATGETLDFEKAGESVLAIVGPFNETKIEGSDIQSNDLQAKIPLVALTNKELFLQSDTFILNNIEYKSISTVIDASESVVTLQLRK